jgi:hypothetical protein
MTTRSRREYGEQLKLRKTGVPGDLEADASLVDAKPHFYADARVLIDSVRGAYNELRDTYPYGLVGFRKFNPNPRLSWLQLEGYMRASAQRAFETVAVPATGCPYHPALKNLGSMSLNPEITQSSDKQRLREIVYPGGAFAPTTIVNILSRMPAIAVANQATVGVEELARNSARTLLHEPLRHPQQHAKAFSFCLADGFGGSDSALVRSSFMPEEVIEDYTQLGLDQAGREAIEWSRPTADFLLRASVRVANRLEGSERDSEGDHIAIYPAGTRLGDIRVDEPTIGCPGSQLAYDMWDQAVDAIVGEGLWYQSVA